MPMEFDEDADAALDQLYLLDRRAADAVEDKLDEIEADPGAAPVRRRLLRPGQVWLITVRVPGGDDLAILWNLGRGEVVRVHYIGPDVFS